MRLYSSQYPIIAREIIRQLTRQSLIEVAEGQEAEAELDVVGVLREYSRMDRQLSERARDLAGAEGRGAEMREKQRLAREKGFKTGEDAIEYVTQQILETFLQSDNIEEIFGEDRELRRAMVLVLRRYADDRSEELDADVRSKLKNLQEGSTAWDIAYEQTMKLVKQRKGLTD
jgi:hypothetical protein